MVYSTEQEQSAEHNISTHESVGKTIGYTALFMAGLSTYACLRYGTPNPIEALTYLTLDTM